MCNLARGIFLRFGSWVAHDSCGKIDSLWIMATVLGMIHVGCEQMYRRKVTSGVRHHAAPRRKVFCTTGQTEHWLIMCQSQRPVALRTMSHKKMYLDWYIRNKSLIEIVMYANWLSSPDTYFSRLSSRIVKDSRTPSKTNMRATAGKLEESCGSLKVRRGRMTSNMYLDSDPGSTPEQT